ncbi:MAG: hypothetical protein IT378_23420 [Sandaracinaceae bacterium]|nr:hypothetical protein [Sandaracinaceae bacterium]
MRLCLALVLFGCGSSVPPPPVDAGPPSEGCTSVRLTTYTAGARGWCELDRTLPILPPFVRQGLTAAVAEPWNGSAYRGDPGEACGECWEVDTISATQTVMITDLCPIEGNTLCAGGHFHLDLASEAAAALMGGALDEGAARRVPCPVTGNVHAVVNDTNEWYLRIAFANHRIPIRAAEVRGAGAGVAADNPWLPLRRSGGAWDVSGDGRALANGGTGVSFRITSAQGQTVESAAVVSPVTGQSFDLGVQLDDVSPVPGGACVFEPPAEIYRDRWGGIDEVRWAINPWGEAEAGFHGETTAGCFSGSCVRVEALGQWSGFHLYYRQRFPTSTFRQVVLRLRTESGEGEVQVSPGNDTDRCTGTRTAVGPDWIELTISLAEVCGGVSMLSSVTVENPGPRIALLLDDVRFEH